eukprot:4855007-Alexandrium_andersonii.AAC.1
MVACAARLRPEEGLQEADRDGAGLLRGGVWGLRLGSRPRELAAVEPEAGAELPRWPGRRRSGASWAAAVARELRTLC